MSPHRFCQCLLKTVADDAVAQKLITREQIKQIDLVEVSISKFNRSFEARLDDPKIDWYGNADCFYDARAQALQSLFPDDAAPEDAT